MLGLRTGRPRRTADRRLLLAVPLVLICADLLLTGQDAQAACSPQAANNITATCTGTTNNQGGGAPGTSAAANGYGTGNETGITVNIVAGAGNTVTGSASGIYVASGTVTSQTGAGISGGQNGVYASTGVATITNSGTITGTNGYGVLAPFGATVTNNAGASITGYQEGINAGIGVLNVTNSGTITGTYSYGVEGYISGTVVNNAGASITGGNGGVFVTLGSANVTNFGSIAGTTYDGVEANTNATVVNGTGAVITGHQNGVRAYTGSASVTNSGTISGGSGDGIFAGTSATVTNNAGASITGGNRGIFAGTSASVINASTISATGGDGVYAATDATVTNNIGASITGGQYGIRALNGAANITNSGIISGSANDGIYAGTNATVTNNTGASITGQDGIYALNGTADVTNWGTIRGSGGGGSGIYANTNATVANKAGASITGGMNGVYASTGVATVTNSGTITGANGYGVLAPFGATVTNNAGASITGYQEGIFAGIGVLNVTNSGTITGTYSYGVEGYTSGTVVNNAGASITGGNGGVFVTLGSADVTNFGSIAGTTYDGIEANTNATVVNGTGATITGHQNGIRAYNGSASVTNSGIISGGGNGIFAGTSATVTNNAGASITGGIYGIAAHSGGSSVFNAGTISGGTAAISFAGSGNTLALAPGSVITGNVLGTGSDTFQLGGSGSASFDVSLIDAAGQYRGFSTFNKIASSIWTLTGISTFAGPVNVNGGTLSVNGNISSANSLTVNAGGTLGGTGIVGSTTINGGTLAPGNSVGTLTVQGSLVFTSAASYLVEVSGTSSDRTNVTSTATLGGATVNAVLNGSVAKRYVILNAAGGVSGTFNPVVSTNLANVTASLSYDANNVYLNFALSFGGGLNANQQAVANALTNAFNTSGSIPAALAALSPGGLTQASGETATGSQQTTFAAMGMFLGLLTDPFSSGRQGGAGQPSAYAADENASAYAATERARSGGEREAYAMIGKAPRAAAFDARWSTWTAGFGGSQTTGGNAVLGSNDTSSRIFGVAAGADYWISPTTVAGVALAGGGTNFSVANGGSGRSDLFQAGSFVRHSEGAGYITAAVAYGWQEITTDRTAAGDQLRAKFAANAWSGRVESGWRFVWSGIGGVGLTPYTAANATTFNLPGYAESVVSGAGPFALGYAAKSVTDTRSELGLRTDKSYALVDALLTLRGRIAWAHDFNPDRSIAATFQTLPGASFVVNGAKPARDSGLVTGTAELGWRNGWSLASTFEGEFSHLTRSYAGKGVVRYAW